MRGSTVQIITCTCMMLKWSSTMADTAKVAKQEPSRAMTVLMMLRN